LANSLTLDRRNKLAQLLVTEGSVKVGKLADMFEVSTETIRKDLVFLESTGVAKKSHGGAIATRDLLERPLITRFNEQVHAKAKIAQAAIQLIPEKGIVLLDAGSTTYSIAKLLTLSHGITVFSNSTPILSLLSDTDNSVFSLGGEMRGRSLSTTGMWTIQAINEIQADICFLGTAGILDRKGPTSIAYSDAEVKKTMIRQSKKTAIVCDSGKFKTNSVIQFCDWSQVDYLITDAGASAETEILPTLQKFTDVIIAFG
jgi:DeoR/GlpR family transcriptional regulator of sugar metabolism